MLVRIPAQQQSPPNQLLDRIKKNSSDKPPPPSIPPTSSGGPIQVSSSNLNLHQSAKGQLSYIPLGVKKRHWSLFTHIIVKISTAFNRSGSRLIKLSMVEVWKSGHYLRYNYTFGANYYLRFYQSHEARVRMFETKNCYAIDAIILMHLHKHESNFWIKRSWHLQYSFRMRSSQWASTLAILGSLVMIQWSNIAASCFGVWQLSWIGTLLLLAWTFKNSLLYRWPHPKEPGEQLWDGFRDRVSRGGPDSVRCGCSGCRNELSARQRREPRVELDRVPVRKL